MILKKFSRRAGSKEQQLWEACVPTQRPLKHGHNPMQLISLSSYKLSNSNEAKNKLPLASQRKGAANFKPALLKHSHGTQITFDSVITTLLGITGYIRSSDCPSFWWTGTKNSVIINHCPLFCLNPTEFERAVTEPGPYPPTVMLVCFLVFFYVWNRTEADSGEALICVLLLWLPAQLHRCVWRSVHLLKAFHRPDSRLIELWTG